MFPACKKREPFLEKREAENANWRLSPHHPPSKDLESLPDFVPEISLWFPGEQCLCWPLTLCRRRCHLLRRSVHCRKSRAFQRAVQRDSCWEEERRGASRVRPRWSKWGPWKPSTTLTLAVCFDKPTELLLGVVFLCFPGLFWGTAQVPKVWT